MTISDTPGTSPGRSTSPRHRRGAALAGIALATGLVIPAVAVPASATPRPRTPATRPAPLQRAADGAVAAGAVGYVARVDDGTRVTTAVSGLADRATGRKLRADDQFEVGSNTKTFVSVLALQLVAQGKLSLGDTVEQHLPGVVPGGDKITLKMLLQHTSGIFNYTDDEPLMRSVLADPRRRWTPQQLVAAAVGHKPYFAPGTSWTYSNTNYILVGMILEKVSGHPVASLLEHRIARPLGLHDTYLVTDVARDTGPGYAHGYVATFSAATKGKSARGGVSYQDVSGWALGSWAGTAGAVVSTTGDLSRFFSALLGGRLLPAAQLAQMRDVVPIPSGTGGSEGSGAYGLGLARVDTPCGPVWGHGGDTLGHHTTAVFSADGRRATVTDATTQPDQLAGPGAGAEKLTTAVGLADLTAICRMFGKPVPAAAAASAAA